MPSHSLESNVALVTGAARRIGAEIVRTLHQAGMNIVVHYNASEEAATLLCRELNQIRAHSAVAVFADLLLPESEKTLVEKAVNCWGRLDALVNNASRFYRTDMGEVTEYAWEDLMHANLKAPFFLSQAAAPVLSKHQGCIVNMADIHAQHPMKQYAVYCISKSGLLMMTKVLAKELGPSVRVNAVSPGCVLWPEGKNSLSEEKKQQIIDRIVLKHAGCPNDIAKAVLFLVRDAEYMTGQILNVDGGRLLSS